MSRTLVVVDPMGFNLMSLGMQYLLLNGTLVQPGDTVYRLPYTNTAGIDNIDDGTDELQDKLTSTSGDIFVFGYSEGAQVVYRWLRKYGTSSPVTPTSRLSFLLIGNAERRYGGFGYKHDNLAEIMDTDGLPDPLEDGTSTVHYAVTDFARQYDGFADFPSSTDIQQAVDSVAAALSDPLNWALKALQDVTNAVIGAHKDAALNAVLGMQMVHTNYFTVTPNDVHNVRYTDPDHPLVEYIWSPTYPVPLLGMGSTFPSLDREKRTAIETAYSRPVVMPTPNYPQISLFTTDFFATDTEYRRVQETGWWPAIRAVISMPVAQIVVTALAPTVVRERDVSLSMAMASVEVRAFKPAVSGGRTITMQLATARVSVVALTPSVSTGVSVTAAVAELTVSALVPSVSTASSVTAELAAAELVVTALPPTVLAVISATVPLNTAGIEVAALTPSVVPGVGAVVSLPAAGVAVSALEPNVHEGLSVALSAARVSVAAYAPSVSVVRSVTVPLSAAGVDVSALAPSVVAGVGVTVAVPIAGVVVDAPVPVVTAAVSATVELSTAGVELSALEPGMLGGRSITLGMTVAGVEVSVETPTVSLTAAPQQAVYAVDLSGLVGGAPSDVVTWPVDGTFDDRVGLGMSITQPTGMTFDADGVLYVADSNKLYRFDGTQSEVSTGISSVFSIVYDDGVFYITDANAKKVYSWDGTTTTQIASAIANPVGLAYGNGLLYILDTLNGIVYSWNGITATTVTTGQFVSIAEDDNGVIYLSSASYVLNIYENEVMTPVATSGISAGHPISFVAVGPAQT